MIDSHAHLYDELFLEDMNSHLEAILISNVQEVWLPNCDSTTWPSLWDLYLKDSRRFKPMIGLHPTYVKQNFQNELKFVYDILKSKRKDLLAIGEIGLDYFWDIQFKSQQIEAFETQSHWAIENHLWIDIHCRKAYADLIYILNKQDFFSLKGVCHCFSGDSREAKKLVDLGFYLGIGGVITFKNAKLFESIKAIPLDYILLETDAPYLSPEPYRGKSNHPKYLPLIAHKLAELYKVSVEEVIEITTQNATKLKDYSVLK